MRQKYSDLDFASARLSTCALRPRELERWFHSVLLYAGDHSHMLQTGPSQHISVPMLVFASCCSHSSGRTNACQGFATDGEVARQRASLLRALHLESSASASRWCAEDPTGKSYRLMQYNPPYTLPWQRTNAVAIRVYEDVAGDSAAVVEDSSQNGGSSTMNTSG